MPIGISDDHEALRATARRWAESRCPPAEARSFLEAEQDALPGWWPDVGGLGWLGLGVSESNGGLGYGAPELAVVLEELGRAVAPGPFLPTAIVSLLLEEEAGGELEATGVLSRVAEGTPATVALGAGCLEARSEGETATLSGALSPVMCAGVCDVLLVPAREPGEPPSWWILDAAQVSAEPLDSLDPTRRAYRVDVRSAALDRTRRMSRLDEIRVSDVAAVLASAEAVGGLGWCLDTASSYAKVREQFGRPIGQFQGVKHRLADVLVDLEKATAATWDAARALAGRDGPGRLSAMVAANLALDGFVDGAKACIQVLGGIGFTWEHDAHIYLKRAASLRQVMGGTRRARAEVGRLAASGARRSLSEELVSALPAGEAARSREEVRTEVAELASLEDSERRGRFVELGYLAPHWPPPWGRGAGPVEQLVIDDELSRAHLHRPGLAIGAWALPTIIAHGTPEQQERWVRPTLLGEISWCQMFSEPGAGSDLANLSTKASRVEGGWRLSGQKVWTSLARDADLAICLARTNPSAPKHAGITYFIVDMRAEGLDIRPLKELTGAAMFNEIFLSDVFVPDDCIVGDVDDGWRLARTTLANERVSMSSGSSFGGGVEGLIALASGGPPPPDPVVMDRVGSLVSDAHSLAILGHRATLRAVSGMDPGPESSVRKLLGVEHEQRVQEAGLELLGPSGAVSSGEGGRWSYGFLANRCLTIAGGTSEVQRNLIAERLLGLPRDPEPSR